MARDRRSAEAHAYRRLYKDKRWRGKGGIRERRLATEPICRMCRQAGRVTPATVADHIQEHKGDPTLFFEFENTQSLCDEAPWRCHSSGKQRMERGKQNQAIGLDGWPIGAS